MILAIGYRVAFYFTNKYCGKLCISYILFVCFITLRSRQLRRRDTFDLDVVDWVNRFCNKRFAVGILVCLIFFVFLELCDFA